MAAVQMWTSKLGNKYQKDDIDRLDHKHHHTLKALRKLPHNSQCAECGASDTTWASVSLGVFVCVRCSDVHRAVGTHISKVKGCSGTYLWGPDEIARMQEIGNEVARGLYGGVANLPASASKEERVEACRQKYERAQAALAARQEAPCTGGAPSAEAAVAPAAVEPAAAKPSAGPMLLSRRAGGPSASWSSGGLAPQPAGAPPPLARAVKDFDFDDFFDGFDVQRHVAKQAPAPAVRPAATVAPQAAAAPQVTVALQPTSDTRAADLDDFLDKCLSGRISLAPAAPGKTAGFGSLIDF